MARVTQRFKSKGIEYVVLQKDDRPLVVESAHLETALLHGAESYPVVCNPDFECWLEVPDDHYSLLQKEMDWVTE